MSRSYFCPHCSKLLNPGTKVIFLVDTDGGCDLMLLSPKLGDYNAVYARSVEFQEGQLYTFRCPVCRANLTAGGDDKLVEILTTEADEAPVPVRFSRVFGEEATFLMADDGVAKFGEHSGRYEGLNFFGAAADPESEIT
jgi:hypothetical protein